MKIKYSLILFSVLYYQIQAFAQENNRHSNRQSEESTKSLLLVSPNPSCCDFLISYKTESLAPVYLKIYDATGKILISKTYRNFSGELKENVDLRSYPGGLYIVQVANDKETSTRKLILE